MFLLCFLAPLQQAAAQWTKIATFDGLISLVKFVDQNNGFVGLGLSPGKLGYPQPPIELYRTSDAGVTWHKCVTPTGYGGEIADILMTDSLNGWLAMTAYGGGQKALWHTTDGGWTWNETTLNGSGTSVRITPYAMIVTDLFNQGHISTDGGASFHDGFLSSTNCADFVDDLHGVISDYRGQHWLVTTDGGITWNPSGMTVEAWTVYGVKGTSTFYSAPEGPTNGQPYNNGLIYKSTDYGADFSQIATFPFRFNGHLAGLSDKLLVFQVMDFDTDRDLVNHGGFYCSSDQGSTWTGIKGPVALNDVRFCLVSGCSGIWLYGFDDKPNCTLWRYAFNIGTGALAPVEQVAILNQAGCQPVDTFVHLRTCGQVTLDSAWLQGSNAFAIASSRPTPQKLGSLDSIELTYQGVEGPDTALLHIRFEFGNGPHDTTILLIGRLASPLLAQPQRLHRESASAYFGAVDTLPLAVDISSAINLDSLWPYLTNISATYSLDSSVASYAAYQPPAGWTLTSLASHGNSVDIGIQNGTTAASQPLDLGTALFRPKTRELATTWVTLPILEMQIGGEPISLCVTDNEDSHWSVKTLGVPSGVTPTPASLHGGEDFAIYPNPAGNELFIENSGLDAAAVTIYDAIGRVVTRTSIAAGVTGTLDVHSIAPGVYFARIVSGSAMSSQTIVKR